MGYQLSRVYKEKQNNNASLGDPIVSISDSFRQSRRRMKMMKRDSSLSDNKSVVKHVSVLDGKMDGDTFKQIGHSAS